GGGGDGGADGRAGSGLGGAKSRATMDRLRGRSSVSAEEHRNGGGGAEAVVRSGSLTARVAKPLDGRYTHASSGDTRDGHNEDRSQSRPNQRAGDGGVQAALRRQVQGGAMGTLRPCGRRSATRLR